MRTAWKAMPLVLIADERGAGVHHADDRQRDSAADHDDGHE